MTAADYPNALEARLARGLDVFVPNVDALPDDWKPEKENWQREGLRSVVGVPVCLGDDVLGALGIVSVRSEHRWRADVIVLVRRIAQLFANALERKRTSRALERQSEFGRIAVSISRALAFAPPTLVGKEIERSIVELARVLHVDEARVFVSDTAGKYVSFYTWLKKPSATLRASIAAIEYESLPWWSERHLEGETIIMRSRESLPASAARERALLENLGFAALIDAPLVDEGRVFGVCGVASASPRSWSPEEVGLVTLIAELIGQALHHQRARDALRQSEERFQTAVEGTSDGLWNWPDVSTDEAWWSSRLYELFGYDDREIPASRSGFEARVHPEDLPRLRAASEGHLTRGVPFDVELRLRPKQGDYVWARLRGRAVRRPDGTARMAGSVQNIGEQKEAEAQLLHVQRMESEGVLEMQ
jgi:PAS domain S-box-containing protein